MGRLVSAGVLVRDQADFFLPGGGANRATGVVAAQLTLTAFAENGLLPWPLADGTLVPDSSISAGTVYFNEISGSPGFYSVRFYPDRTGYWRVVLKNAALSAEVVREFDVTPAGPIGPPNGLNASFLPPGPA
jgi:hypothetical protein